MAIKTPQRLKKKPHLLSCGQLNYDNANFERDSLGKAERNARGTALNCVLNERAVYKLLLFSIKMLF